VAGRESVFAHPEIIRLATAEYVAVAADDWYQRRRGDAEGEFFRQVANQGPRKGAGGATRQGVYCLTASGKLLTYRNHHDPDVMLSELRKGLAAWKGLPETERKPGAVEVPPQRASDLDKTYHRAPPPGALIVNVYTRALERDAEGKYIICSGGKTGYEGFGTALDHLWVTAEECRRLVAQATNEGKTFPLPDTLARRMVRFHLVDNTRGEPDYWPNCSWDLVCRVLETDPLRLELQGSALLTTDADPAAARRGYDVAILGKLTYDQARQTFTRFDIVALGDHWGEGTYTRRARPGKTPLGVAFELGDPANPRDRIPPQAARNASQYLNP
jgi:hypothetical protein